MITILLFTTGMLMSPPQAEIHPATDTVLQCVCSTHPDKKSCREARRQDVSGSLHKMQKVADEFPKLPGYMRLPYLAAYACGESGFNEQPICGADRSCYDACMSKIPENRRIGRPRSKCIQQCDGIERCNDRGRSEGIFQLGKYHRRRLLKRTGDVYAAFDVETAARYVLESLTKNYSKVVADCKNDGSDRWGRYKRWDMVAYRWGKGPTMIHARKATKSCAPDLRTGKNSCIIEPAQKRIPRCFGQSRYVPKGYVWWSKDRSIWES